MVNVDALSAKARLVGFGSLLFSIELPTTMMMVTNTQRHTRTTSEWLVKAMIFVDGSNVIRSAAPRNSCTYEVVNASPENCNRNLLSTLMDPKTSKAKKW